jgi:hypothetical protein
VEGADAGGGGDLRAAGAVDDDRLRPRGAGHPGAAGISRVAVVDRHRRSVQRRECIAAPVDVIAIGIGIVEA